MRYEIYVSNFYDQFNNCLVNGKIIGKAITLKGVWKIVKSYPETGYFEVLDKFGFKNRMRFKK